MGTKTLLTHIKVFLLLGTLILFFNLSYIGCPIRFATSIPCPTCGMTRALISLLRLDFVGYFYYLPTALPLLASILILIHRDAYKPFKGWAASLFIGLSLLLTLLIYLYRLYYHLIP